MRLQRLRRIDGILFDRAGQRSLSLPSEIFWFETGVPRGFSPIWSPVERPSELLKMYGMTYASRRKGAARVRRNLNKMEKWRRKQRKRGWRAWISRPQENVCFPNYQSGLGLWTNTDVFVRWPHTSKHEPACVKHFFSFLSGLLLSASCSHKEMKKWRPDLRLFLVLLFLHFGLLSLQRLKRKHRCW